MTATCQLCGEILRSHLVIGLGIPGSENGQPTVAQAAEEIMLFDVLANDVARHLLQRHPAQAKEMTEVSHVAAKVYAMIHADSEDDKFKALRTAWRKGLIARIVNQRDEAAGAAPEDSTGGGSSSSSGSGSGL